MDNTAKAIEILWFTDEVIRWWLDEQWNEYIHDLLFNNNEDYYMFNDIVINRLYEVFNINARVEMMMNEYDRALFNMYMSGVTVHDLI